jgi:tRNA(Arg) A34 adenosine deaminase TadA
MKLTKEQVEILKDLMVKSARKGNLATSGIVLENGKLLVSADSPVNSSTDATAHSERLLVEKACKIKGSAFNLGLSIVTVVEPCLMCMSACAWAGFKEIGYIIPADKYLDKIPWMSEIKGVDKQKIAESFTEPLKLIHLKKYENEFCEVFEKEMHQFLK